MARFNKEVMTVIVPIYKNELFIPALLTRVESLSSKLKELIATEFVFVIDGSPDNSEGCLVVGLKSLDIRWRICSHSRNFGSWAAIESGLSETGSAYYLIMSADLQEPENLILSMADSLITDQKPLVVGTRMGRSDGVIKDVSSNIAWWLVRNFTNKSIPKNGVDIFGCNKIVADYLLGMSEVNSSLIGKLFWLGVETENIPYERQARDGESGWTFSKKFKYLTDSIFSFSKLPIVIIQLTGILGIVISTVVSVVVLLNWSLGNVDVSGYTPIMLMLSFGFSTNLLAFGIIGSYIWRVFENVKGRPRAVISKKYSVKDIPAT